MSQHIASKGKPICPCVSMGGGHKQPVSTLTPQRRQHHTQQTENSTQVERNQNRGKKKKVVRHTCWSLNKILKSLPLKGPDLQGSSFLRRRLPTISASSTGILLAVCQALENSTSPLSGESILPGCGWLMVLPHICRAPSLGRLPVLEPSASSLGR